MCVSGWNGENAGYSQIRCGLDLPCVCASTLWVLIQPSKSLFLICEIKIIIHTIENLKTQKYHTCKSPDPSKYLVNISFTIVQFHMVGELGGEGE